MKKFLTILLLLFILIGCNDPVVDDNDDDNNNNNTNTDTELVGYEVYDWFVSMQLDNGLLESAEYSNIVSLYDNALAAIVFTMFEDYERAQDIFSYFDGIVDSELKDNISGFAQFRDRYGFIKDYANRWLGDNAWLLIALNFYEYYSEDYQYSNLKSQLELWIRSLAQEDGSLLGGYTNTGGNIMPVTEAMLDAFNAVSGYDSLHQGILQFFEEERYSDFYEVITAWPGNPYVLALDVHAWSYSILPDVSNDVLDLADLFKMEYTIGENVVYGYSFDIDLDTIWIEGTMEMAVAYNLAGLEHRANELIVDMEYFMINSNNFTATKGLPYASNMGTHYAQDPLWDGVDTNICISSSAWYLFALNRIDPFIAGKDKDIPQEDIFYSN